VDPKQLQGKVQDFAQRLLQEAQGDPVRALGLLVLVLESSEFARGDHTQRLMLEVRKALMPDETRPIETPIQHLAGDVSWEGVQHCLRCAKVLANRGQGGQMPMSAGYVYEIGVRFTSDDCDQFDTCV
jgi:hypothetical protein